MQNARENLHGLWRSHKGLVVLLFVGLTISLLAVLAPQAWATPGQRVLGQTITDIEPDKLDCYRACDEPVYFETTGDGFNVSTDTVACVYVTENVTWTLGTTDVDNLTVYHTTQVTIGADGHFDPNPVLIWEPPLETDPGFYDVFFDVNCNTVLDNDDAVFLPEGPPDGDLERGAGICVVPCAIGGTTIPGQAAIRPMWVAIAAMLGGAAAAGFVWRRRRG